MLADEKLEGWLRDGARFWHRLNPVHPAWSRLEDGACPFGPSWLPCAAQGGLGAEGLRSDVTQPAWIKQIIAEINHRVIIAISNADRLQFPGH